ncbi:hypothetical protein D3C79_637990 [compost metagenome]
MGAELHAFSLSDQALDVRRGQFAQVVCQRLQPVQAVVVAINARILCRLPVIQRFAHLLLPGFKGVPNTLALSVNARWDLLLLGRQLLTLVFDCCFGARNLIGHGSDFLTAFDSFQVRDHCQELVDLHANLVQPWLKTLFSAVHCQRCFLRRGNDQFFFCGHAKLPRHPCGGR